MLTPEKQREAVARLLATLRAEKFFGEVIMQFRDGNLVMTRVNQTLPTEALLSESLSLPAFRGARGD
jgi:hypothetical protein